MRPSIGAVLGPLVWGLTLWALAAGTSAAADFTAPQVIEALRRHVCFSNVWWGDPYVRLGQTATVDMRIDGRRAYLWSEDMRSVPRVPRWADSYVVYARSAGPVVIQRSGYNIDLLKGDPAYERERRRVYAGPSQRLRVELPTSCEPRFDPDTPLRTEMKAVVVSSLATAITTWGRRPTKGQVRMNIARFNIDFPETFALREDTGEILRIGLISGDPASYTGGSHRQYVVVPVPRGPQAAKLRRLIQKHGEPRTISIR